MIKNYFITSLRNVLRNKTFSFIKIFSLSIGLICGLMLILFVNDEVNYDRFHTKIDRTFRVTTSYWNPKSNERQLEGFTANPAGLAFKQEVPEVEAFSRLINGGGTIQKQENVLEEQWLYVDQGFFSIFSFPWLYGNSQTAFPNLNSVVISESTASKYFGTKQAVGRELSINVNGKFEVYRVTGVVANVPQNSSIQFNILLPFSVYQRMNPNKQSDWSDMNTNTFVLLSPDAQFRTIGLKFNLAFHKHAILSNTNKINNKGKNEMQFALQPLKEIHLYSRFVTGNGIVNSSHPIISYLLAALALFVIVISSINFVNLSIAQSLRRSKEIGIRKVIGASRGQLIAQFLGESLFLCTIAFITAVCCAIFVLPYFSQVVNKALTLSYFVHLPVIAGCICLLLIVAIAAGFYPALVLSGFKPIKVISGRQKLTGKLTFGKSLVVVQFVIAGFVIMFTVVIYSQSVYLQQQDLGYNPDNLVRMPLNEDSNTKLALYKNELMDQQALLGITGQSSGLNQGTVQIAGKDITTQQIKIDENYLQTFQISLLSGRNFSRNYPSDSAQSVIVNESFVREAHILDPLGKSISFPSKPDKKYQIIGVVHDYNFRSLREPVQPLILDQFSNQNYGEVWVRVKPENLHQALSALEKASVKIEPNRPFDFSFMNDLNSQEYRTEAKLQKLLSFIAILTIIISCMGLFGLVALSIEQRQKEIGIRKLMGAPVLVIVALLNKNLARLVGIALLIALPLGQLVASQWLRSYAYRIQIGWNIYLMAGGIILLIAVCAVSYQSFKAALAKPVNVLNKE